MACPTNYAITSYTLQQLDGVQNFVRYEYKCCSVYQATSAIANTYDHETPRSYTPPGSEQAQYLDRQTIACSGGINHLINSIEMASTGVEIWFKLKCLAINPAYTVPVLAGGTQPFNMNLMKTFYFKDTPVDCQYADGADKIGYLVESKLEMLYDPDPDQGKFNVKCGVMGPVPPTTTTTTTTTTPAPG